MNTELAIQQIYDSFERLAGRQGSRMAAQVHWQDYNGAVVISHLEWEMNPTEEQRKNLIRSRLETVQRELDRRLRPWYTRGIDS